ncbi:TIGR01620 family protein [Bowmanella denitrificans]|uniref:TIGR01620 family protein n=1 Tax=Bowmanella denitrificans TaxID=366582 RepID=A0ABN0XIH2_9ALTE
MKEQGAVTNLMPRIEVTLAGHDELQSAEALRKAIKLDGDVDLEEMQACEQADIAADVKEASRPGKLFWLFCAFLLLGGVQLAVDIWNSVQSFDWLSLAWAGLWSLSLAGVLFLLAKEWRSYRKLDKREHLQHLSASLSESPAIGEARDFCENLLRQMPASVHQDAQQWQTALQQHYSDQEVMQLFEQYVLAPADKKALAEVSRESAASAALIAVSPFVVLDMFLVLWRNLRMVNRLCACYGVKTGYLAKVTLLKRTVRTMLYAGATELLAEASAWALGGSLTAKLSTRMAQGVGAGVLTARFGVQAIRICRPMPFIHQPAPQVSQIAASIVKQLGSTARE